MKGPPAQRHRIALLALVARAPRHLLSREKLTGCVWPEVTDASARQLLNASVYELRKAIGEAALVSEIGALRLDPLHVRIDTIEFEAAAAGGELEAAAALYAGSFLEGLSLPGAVEFDHWTDAERDDLERAYCGVLEQLAQRSSSTGDDAGAINRLRQRLSRTPADGRIVQRLMEAMLRMGDRVGALEVARAHAALLAVDFESGPDPEVEALAADVRAGGTGRRQPRPASQAAPPTDNRSSAPDVHDDPFATPDPRAASPGSVARGITSPGAAVPGPRPASFWWRLRSITGSSIRHHSARMLLLVVLLGMAVSLWAMRDRVPKLVDVRGASDTSPMSIAVFPFRVYGGPGAEHLGEGMMDLLSQAVDGLGELRRIDPLAVMSRLRSDDLVIGASLDLQQARSIAAQLGAGRFLMGVVFELGDSITINASLYDVDASDPRSTGSVEGSLARLPRLTEELARQLLLTVPLGSGGHLEQLGTVNAASHEALRQFLKAAVLLRRGAFDSAGVLLQGAVELDSTFALAWHHRALAAGWGAAGPAVDFAARALQYADRLGSRDRLLAAASHAFFFGDGVGVDSLARTAVAEYPLSAEAWFWLASVRLHYRWQLGTTLEELREATDRVLALDSMFQPALSMATDQAITDRRYVDARALLARAPTGGGAGPIRFGDRVVLAHVFGDDAERRQSWEELEASSVTWIWIAANRLLQTDSLEAAERVLTLLMTGPARDDWSRRTGAVHMAHLQLARGRFTQAAAGFERASILVPEAVAAQAVLSVLPFYERGPDELMALRRTVFEWQAPRQLENAAVGGARLPDPMLPWIREYALGLLSARLRDSTMAHHYATLLETASAPPDGFGLRRDLAREIRALFALESGRPDEALHILGERPQRVGRWGEVMNFPLTRRPIWRFLRAEALFRLEREDEALRWLSTFERQWSTTEYVLLGPAYFRMATIYENRREGEAARDYYTRFADRWSGADSEYRPLLETARRRAERLGADRFSRTDNGGR